MNSVISVSGFFFNYLRSDLVLKNVNIEIEKGSFTVIIGPSGAGKIMPVKSKCWANRQKEKRFLTWP